MKGSIEGVCGAATYPAIRSFHPPVLDDNEKTSAVKPGRASAGVQLRPAEELTAVLAT